MEDIPDLEQNIVLSKIRPFSVLDGDLTDSTLVVLLTQYLDEIRKTTQHIKGKVDEKNEKEKLPSQKFKELMKILNSILPKLPYEPNIFKNISHDTLCNQFELFLRINLIKRNIEFDLIPTHGFNENGIDLLLTFIKSGLKIGFQFKTYDDIQEEKFTNTVYSQIIRSSIMCDHYFIAFGGDMTNKSHRLKINHMIAVIKQSQDKHTHVIHPGICLSIIEGVYIIN